MSERRAYARVSTPVGERSRTKQSFAEESDVNAIMRKYLATGIIEHQNREAPRYGDFTNADDYLSAVNRIKSADASFAALPAKVRDHVENDPAKLLALVFDPERREEAAELGLVEPMQAELPLGEGAVKGGDPPAPGEAEAGEASSS